MPLGCPDVVRLGANRIGAEERAGAPDPRAVPVTWEPEDGGRVEHGGPHTESGETVPAEYLSNACGEATSSVVVLRCQFLRHSTAVQSPFCARISHVFGVRAEEQVGRVAARRVVTPVADL
jgi:hypothetical protein